MRDDSIDASVHYYDVLWGGNDAEWVFLHACETLADDDASSNAYYKISTNAKFAQALNGAHLICGAAGDVYTYTGIVNDGPHVAEFLTGTNGRSVQTVKEAWFRGIDLNHGYMPSQTTLRVLAEDYSYINDYIWGQGTGPVSDVGVDNYYFSWDFTCIP